MDRAAGQLLPLETGGVARPTLPAHRHRRLSRFLQIVSRQGFRKAPAETALEFAAKLGAAKPQGAGLREPAMVFTELYQALRFGHRAVSAADLEASLQALPGQKPKRIMPAPGRAP